MKDRIEQIVLENKNLIYKIATNISKRFGGMYNVEDLFQVGVIGIIKACKNFKEDYQCKITTYASKYIIGEIFEYIRHDRNVKVSPDAIKIYKAYEKTKEFLTNKNGKVPSLKEISEFMNLEENKLAQILETCQFTVSLDGALTDEDFTLEKVTGTDTRNKIDTLIDIKNEIQKLSQRDRKLIELRYFQDYSQSETAECLGMNQVQVSRCEKLILKKMEKNMTS